MNNQRKIRMIARNPLTGQREEVFPEDEVKFNEMTPIFLGSDGKYYTVPGCSAEMAYVDWVAQDSTRQ